MKAQHPDRRGRGGADAAAALQSRSRRLRGRDGGARRRGRHCGCKETHARSGRAGLDAAGPVRHRALPPAAGAAGDQAAADHHADRARRGERARARPGDRRRRLHRQAVLGAGAAGARARAAAPRAARAARRRADVSATSSSTARRSGSSRAGRADRSRADRVPPAGIPDGASRPGVLARAVARRRLGHATSISTSAPSTCMSAACARRSTAAASADPIRTVRGAGYALDDRFGKAAERRDPSCPGDRRKPGYPSIAARRTLRIERGCVAVQSHVCRRQLARDGCRVEPGHDEAMAQSTAAAAGRGGGRAAGRRRASGSAQ